MKKVLSLLLVTSMSLPLAADAQKSKKRTAPSGKRTTTLDFSGSSESKIKSQLSNAIEMAQSGQYEGAANSLFSLSRRSELIEERPQLKYLLGNMLIELKLYQSAAFQFVDVIRLNHPKYSKMAIEKLSMVADFLGDDTILNYAISKVDVNDIPSGQRDMIHFRLGEIKLRNHDSAGAQDSFAKVGPASSYYHQALFSKSIAALELSNPDVAIGTLRTMLDSRSKAPVTDVNRVEAQLGLARAYYQKQDWDAAIEAYSQIPRDTLAWHDAIFEQSWAMLRAARFRSVLSNFQSLHSTYYDEFYIPESLLLRSIVYLYICKYDEMEKVLGLFERSYGPVKEKIKDYLNTTSEPVAFYNELEKVYRQVKGSEKNQNLRLPYIVMKNVLAQGDVKRSIHYLEKLAAEKSQIEKNSALKSSALGQYALKIISNRSVNAKIAIGDMVKAHLQNMGLELNDLFEQAGFIRYEMINGKKETVKKKIAGKDIEEAQVDDNRDRSFYIENGYQYYPFQGEYWLDEVGNYHYLGKQSCE